MKLFVYRDDKLVGQLSTSDAGICFQYSSAYQGPDAYPLSLSLPIQTEAHPQNKTLPFFEGLLPEGDQRRELGNLLHVSPGSTMRLLKALAGECVGNLTIIDEDMSIEDLIHKSAYIPLGAEELEALLRPQSIERARFIVSKRLSLAGAQAKFGLYYDSGEWFATKGLAPTTHIIKPTSLFDPTVLINEFFVMRLAKSCGVDVPDTSIIRSGEHYGFAVERFDRARVQGRVVRLGQEDLCQALSIMPEEKYEEEGGPGFSALFATTLHHTARPAQNIQRLLRLTLFNYLVGNCDAHAKNFSLLESRAGIKTLAPAYDLISTTFYGDRLLRSMAMRIGKHSRIDKVSAEDIALFSEETGVSLAAIASELASLREALANRLDEVVEMVAQEASEHFPVARQLREHLLLELEQRVVL
ncbi:MAG: type II toxin-antitoxin system HipA family toxin [Coriobacteriia bacterium]|nr:type II toxin-antitoxin system HipA family toxin [Coriobacteriia bacterium]MCL2750433.1 type II toxin-antitoxin system HipA family toxin [Coriobacteriia bacterium]